MCYVTRFVVSSWSLVFSTATPWIWCLMRLSWVRWQTWPCTPWPSKWEGQLWSSIETCLRWKLVRVNPLVPQEGVEMVISLKRKILNEMMTTYLPSLLLIVITCAYHTILVLGSNYQAHSKSTASNGTLSSSPVTFRVIRIPPPPRSLHTPSLKTVVCVTFSKKIDL